ncbi:hypothetical protein NDU88_007980 [Pleurodeles waltl]|uniref:Uncharacterized protein n=1 Tax=Pleurodeles waltl TaxID=8319 RepID=A0AAV7RUR4_PLEWA|nr:hypothetical protein NDU88_007980 [Pleurodeles waltl]
MSSSHRSDSDVSIKTVHTADVCGAEWSRLCCAAEMAQNTLRGSKVCGASNNWRSGKEEAKETADPDPKDHSEVRSLGAAISIMPLDDAGGVLANSTTVAVAATPMASMEPLTIGETVCVAQFGGLAEAAKSNVVTELTSMAGMSAMPIMVGTKLSAGGIVVNDVQATEGEQAKNVEIEEGVLLGKKGETVKKLPQPLEVSDCFLTKPCTDVD